MPGMPRIEPVQWDDQRAVTISSADPHPEDAETYASMLVAVGAVQMTLFVPGDDPERPADGERVEVEGLRPANGVGRYAALGPHVHGWTVLRFRPVNPPAPSFRDLGVPPMRERVSVRVALLNVPAALSEWIAYWLPGYGAMCPVSDCTGEGGCWTVPVAHVSFNAWWRDQRGGHARRFEALRMRLDALYAPTGRAGNVFGTLESVDVDEMGELGRSRFYRLWTMHDTETVPPGV